MSFFQKAELVSTLQIFDKWELSDLWDSVKLHDIDLVGLAILLQRFFLDLLFLIPSVTEYVVELDPVGGRQLGTAVVRHRQVLRKQRIRHIHLSDEHVRKNASVLVVSHVLQCYHLIKHLL
jgi:hypothetical protein